MEQIKLVELEEINGGNAYSTGRRIGGYVGRTARGVGKVAGQAGKLLKGLPYGPIIMPYPGAYGRKYS